MVTIPAERSDGDSGAQIRNAGPVPLAARVPGRPPPPYGTGPERPGEARKPSLPAETAPLAHPRSAHRRPVHPRPSWPSLSRSSFLCIGEGLGQRSVGERERKRLFFIIFKMVAFVLICTAAQRK
ncbi:Hypothetical predicted protein [Marmota monax]|uniref:Uncharacterized protein n=1 Tax=Marmota monax TaxID=9995 RepID=A0A5E4CQN1_MARMO|nr:hypothetical protein GHT09_011660 [Marmota monax]VTJ83331.1 Hypothetical predicted protein [Marmota monax]